MTTEREADPVTRSYKVLAVAALVAVYAAALYSIASPPPPATPVAHEKSAVARSLPRAAASISPAVTTVARTAAPRVAEAPPPRRSTRVRTRSS